ncbi:MAG TPA: ABC transporter ATP-binding protein [Mycobacteriales bacterium]|nr:ABC transporter ATP-binding protein [Mycobacteriales bacterium]
MRALLEVEGLSARYGEAVALSEATLEVREGEVVTLVGRNGAGKTTFLRAVMGLHPASAGTVRLAGKDVTRTPPHRRARLGLGWVPDDRGVYSTLTVEENLTLPPVVGPAGWSMERIGEAFPVLAERRTQMAGHLSGGEQQMLAMARVLRSGARLLLCDEPTEGLSPLIVQQIGAILREVKAHGVTVLLVEQNVHFAATVADRHYLLAEGRVVDALTNSEMKSREHELLDHLGV